MPKGWGSLYLYLIGFFEKQPVEHYRNSSLDGLVAALSLFSCIFVCECFVTTCLEKDEPALHSFCVLDIDLKKIN